MYGLDVCLSLFGREVSPEFQPLVATRKAAYA